MVDGHHGLLVPNLVAEVHKAENALTHLHNTMAQIVLVVTLKIVILKIVPNGGCSSSVF